MTIFRTGDVVVPPTASADKPLRVELKVEQHICHLAVRLPYWLTQRLNVRILLGDETLFPPRSSWLSSSTISGTGPQVLLRDGSMDLGSPPHILTIEASSILAVRGRNEIQAFELLVGSRGTLWDDFDEAVKERSDFIDALTNGPILYLPDSSPPEPPATLPPARIFREVTTRLTLQILLVAGGFILLILLLQRNLRALLPLLFLLLGLLTYNIWRCPNCSAFLGSGRYPKTCPRCGVPLRRDFTPEVTPDLHVLLLNLHSNNRYTRINACHQLRMLRTIPPEALEALRTASGHSDSATSEAARSALAAHHPLSERNAR